MAVTGRAAFVARFGVAPEAAGVDADALDRLVPIMGRASCRAFRDAAVDPTVLRAVGAAALSSPSKSDLQQRDVMIVADPDRLARLKALVAAQPWIAGAPAMLVVCADNHRQRRLHARRGRAFANDHLDAFFNASIDAGIALATAVVAAEALGLGCCPVSTIRNEADAASDLLGLPDHVFAVAALAVGWPAEAERPVSPRLPLSHTLHLDRYDEAGLDAALDAYDARHVLDAPRRQVERFGAAEPYAWSDDKTRQYAAPERAGWGDHVRRKGFRLE